MIRSLPTPAVRARTGILFVAGFALSAAASGASGQARESRADTGSAPSPADSISEGPPVATDALVLGTGTAAYGLVASWLCNRCLENPSFENVRKNLGNPVGRLGSREDDDGFFHNYVSHPLVWGGLGIVLRERGYGPWGALAVTQAHSVWWEYVVEGVWKPPSRVDMLTNLVSPVVTIFVLHPLAEELGDDGAEGEGRDTSHGPRVRVRTVPLGGGRGTALTLTVSVP